MDPVYIPLLSTSIGALISGIFAVIVVIIGRPPPKPPGNGILLVDRFGKPIRRSPSSKLRLARIPKTVKWLVAATLILIGGTMGNSYGKSVRNASFNIPEVTPDSVSETPLPIATATIGPTPTLVPEGLSLMEINFAWVGEGRCNDYDRSKLGYDSENQRYYINQGTSGYIAVCHKNGSLLPQGTLEITAYPDPEAPPRDYGFAVLFGWKGGGVSTTDACIFGIRRRGEFTEAFFQEVVDGNWSPPTTVLETISLDNNRNTLRVVMNENYEAVGYLNKEYIGTYKYTQCSAGPIGLVALGSEGANIYFDDLKFFELP